MTKYVVKNVVTSSVIDLWLRHGFVVIGSLAVFEYNQGFVVITVVLRRFGFSLLRKDATATVARGTLSIEYKYECKKYNVAKGMRKGTDSVSRSLSSESTLLRAV